MQPNLENKKGLYRMAVVFLVVLSLYFAVKFLAEVRSYNLSGGTPGTIALSGHGEVQAVSDIASISFTVESSQSTQSASSEDVNKKTGQILSFVKSAGIASADVKTDNYSSYPKYSNPTVCPMYILQGGALPPCNQGDSVIIGYTVSESLTVKVRKVDDASKIIDGINKIGVTNMNGPNFTIDNPDALQAEARQKAINDAKTKAEELVKELGMHLGRVSAFNESGNYPMPIMYGAAKADSVSAPAAPTPSQTPTGQNTISSDVTITYEIY